MLADADLEQASCWSDAARQALVDAALATAVAILVWRWSWPLAVGAFGLLAIPDLAWPSLWGWGILVGSTREPATTWDSRSLRS